MLLCRTPQFGSLIHARTAVAMVILLSANLLFAETLSATLRRYDNVDYVLNVLVKSVNSRAFAFLSAILF